MIPVLATTLVPTAPSLDEAFVCIFCGERAMADGLLNLILFVPLGIGLRSAVGTPARSVLAGTLIPCLIEVTQFLIPGRDSGLGDVLANGVGTGIGALFAAFGPRFVRLSDRSSAQLSLAAAFGAISVFTLAGYLHVAETQQKELRGSSATSVVSRSILSLSLDYHLPLLTKRS